MNSPANPVLDLLYNPNAMTTTAGADYATANWLGSVTGLISPAGSQVSSTTYTPYGTPTTTGTPVSPVSYASSYTLPGSAGLDDMNARDYNPANGTFTSVDPMLANTSQPYAYASDSPVAETGGLPRGGSVRNPDVVVGEDGEVYPLGPGGRAAEDSIGNILDYLADSGGF